MRYCLFTDGACEPNPGKGGWAFILRAESQLEEVIRSGFKINTTNNRMELLAVLRGLEYYKKNICQDTVNPLLVYSDSQYLVGGINLWMKGWKSRNWKKKNGKQVLNEDLWKEIDLCCQGIDISCIHVIGHADHADNNRCDELAVNAIKRSKDLATSSGEFQE